MDKRCWPCRRACARGGRLSYRSRLGVLAQLNNRSALGNSTSSCSSPVLPNGPERRPIPPLGRNRCRRFDVSSAGPLRLWRDCYCSRTSSSSRRSTTSSPIFPDGPRRRINPPLGRNSCRRFDVVSLDPLHFWRDCGSSVGSVGSVSDGGADIVNCGVFAIISVFVCLCVTSVVRKSAIKLR